MIFFLIANSSKWKWAQNIEFLAWLISFYKCSLLLFLCHVFLFTYFNFTMVDFEINSRKKKKHTLHNAFYNQKEPNAKQNLTVFFRKFRINAGAVTATVSGGNRMNIKVTRSINYLIYSNVWIIDNNLVIAIKNRTYFYRLIKLKYEIDWKSVVNSYHRITKVYLNKLTV